MKENKQFVPARQLTISVVTYHSDLLLLQKTLSSVLAAALEAEKQVSLLSELVLIDNAQQKPQLQQILKTSGWNSRADLIESGANLGFGKANNLAIHRANSDYHLVLNPDVEVDTAALSNAVRYLENNPQVVAVSPACRNMRNEVESLCKRHPPLLLLLLRGFAPGWLKRKFKRAMEDYECVELLKAGVPVAVPLVSGCFIVARTSALKLVGGFDEDFFLYFEDFALSKSLSAKGELHYLPNCHIVHHGGYAARKGIKHIYLFLCSALNFYRKFGWRLW